MSSVDRTMCADGKHFLELEGMREGRCYCRTLAFHIDDQERIVVTIARPHMFVNVDESTLAGIP